MTPHLRALFPAGATGDSSLCALFATGLTPCTARAPYRLEWVREQGPLHTAAADVGLLSCEWECPLHTAVADVGLLSCEWESVLYTQQSLMWGCYHVNERVSSTHGRPLLGGAGFMWIREQCLPKHSSRWWSAGIVWMSEEPSDCALHTAERRSEAGAACLDSGFFCAASVATWEPFAPASALGTPHRHGRGTWEDGLMPCPAGPMGERNADI